MCFFVLLDNFFLFSLASLHTVRLDDSQLSAGMKPGAWTACGLREAIDYIANDIEDMNRCIVPSFPPASRLDLITFCNPKKTLTMNIGLVTYRSPSGDENPLGESSKIIRTPN